MNAVGRIPQQGDARGHESLGQLQAERIGENGPLDREFAQELTEPPRQMGLEHLRPGGFQRLAPRGALGPDQAGPIVSQRQDCEGATGQEVLMRYAAMRPFHPHRRHHAGLRIVPADGANPCG